MWYIKCIETDEYFAGILLGKVWTCKFYGDALWYKSQKEANDIINRLKKNGCSINFVASKAVVI